MVFRKLLLLLFFLAICITIVYADNTRIIIEIDGVNVIWKSIMKYIRRIS